MHTAVNDQGEIDNQSSGFGMFRHIVFNQSVNSAETAALSDEVKEN